MFKGSTEHGWEEKKIACQSLEKVIGDDIVEIQLRERKKNRKSYGRVIGFSLASVQRVRPEENVVCTRFYKAHSLLFSRSLCLESKQRRITSMI